uniref:Shikimate dehydrogenase (NADP(+)) n=1 Tax=uncultured Thiotrichaceae bacterium TaxID=298394 RepID=A0A6S6S5H9_9GAMM|nr:MAG: Shikimate 5-dehydrogenase I alpha (EC [uncultured Thiotrichaceae bacterium]
MSASSSEKIKRFAVIGQPISHSKSPRIHRQFAQLSGVTLSYEAIEAPVDGFNETIDRLRGAGWGGCNVTMPFKEQAWQMADERSVFAERAGAVNTLVFRDDGSIYGDTTDGSGLVRDLTHNLQFELKDKRILLLGAGGAVRGVLEPLLAEQPASLFVANRTASKAIALAEDFTDAGVIRGGGFDDIEGQFDLIINGTATGLKGGMLLLPDDCLVEGGGCYDLTYSDADTAFMSWGREHNAGQVSDGLGMLVEQAADAFHIWHAVRPETATVLADLR